MKIVSWNCRGKFREKFHLLRDVEADIYVIQECEDPNKYPEEYATFNKQCFWYGDSANKGLGVFFNSELKVKQNKWETYCLRNFISLRINDIFNLLGVWACYPYIEEYFIYQSINYKYYDSDMVIIGDFNSNYIWDKKHGKRNHGEVVKMLESKGLVSAYHYTTSENQGKETQKTFYLYKHIDKSYHIDHCFANREKIKSYSIYGEDIWLKYSDHRPIEIIVDY